MDIEVLHRAGMYSLRYCWLNCYCECFLTPTYSWFLKRPKGSQTWVAKDLKVLRSSLRQLWWATRETSSCVKIVTAKGYLKTTSNLPIKSSLRHPIALPQGQLSQTIYTKKSSMSSHPILYIISFYLFTNPHIYSYILSFYKSQFEIKINHLSMHFMHFGRIYIPLTTLIVQITNIV